MLCWIPVPVLPHSGYCFRSLDVRFTRALLVGPQWRRSHSIGTGWNRTCFTLCQCLTTKMT
ncbi:hypothetical protein AB205_0138230 [Aquarana catesbeiana]|uniref:Uncharacterized protein n=1 Tax=Aquarana catesbeiana TaxID=8400 RepID=A0A2G9P171_AQUCT|nr:hypothetical protein AB205_0138230 [Aquarana catesbeiana]